MRTRIAIVGAGGVARRHATILREFEDVVLVGVCDVQPQAARAMAEDVGTTAYRTLHDLLDESRPDAVYVCVPPFAHGEPELELVARGIPFFVEKPLAASLTVAEEIAAAVAEGGLLTATGYHWRYLEGVARAREILADTPARLTIGAWLDKVPPVAWWVSRERSGGQVIEQATHVLDVMLDLMGDVRHVYGIASYAQRAAYPDADVDDVTCAALHFECGAVGSLAATSLLSGKHRAGVELFCDGRRLELTETGLAVDDGRGPVRHADPGRAKRLVDRTFVDAVQGRGDDVRAPYAVALRTHRVACAIARSAVDGVPLHLERSGSARRAADGGRRAEHPASSNGDGYAAAGAADDRRRNGTARAIAVAEPGRASVHEVELPPVTDGCFAVETLYSGISAGTELTYLKGTNPYLTAAWDAELGVFRRDRPSAGYPVRRLGYMEVGRVVESRARSVDEGSLVAMAYGHCDRHVADAKAERHVRVPEGLEPLLGIYVAHMGPICANGLLHAAAEISRGDVRRLSDGVDGLLVLVHGAGTVGLLTALLASHLGAAEVAVVDRTPRRLAAAQAIGCWAIDERDGPPWEVVKERWRHGAADRGADVVFQCRGREAALAEALRCLRPQGTVIDMAFYSGGASELCLGEEFHHNGLTIRCAQIGRVPRGLNHLWDRERLSRETIALLQARGDDIRRHVVTDVVPFAEGPALLADIAERRRDVIQAVLAC